MKLRTMQWTVAILIIFAAMILPLKGLAASPMEADSADVKGLTVFQQAPFTLDGLTYVPVRELAGFLGLNLTWDPEQNLVVLDDGQAAFNFERLSDEPGWGSFVPRYNYRSASGVSMEPEIWPFFQENGHLFLPLRHMANFFDWKIVWLPEQKKVLLTADGPNGERRSLYFNVTNPFSRYLWPPPQRIAYLTFDDGPGEKVTPLILDILAKENIKATFFVVGERVRRYPEILQRIYEEGHTVGNHTYTHQPAVLFSGVGLFMDEVRKTDEVIYGVTGQRTSLFRMPYGTGFAEWPAYRSMLERNGYRHVGWNVNSFDANAQNVSAERILNAVKQQTYGKDVVIILFHDLGSHATVEALPEVIRFLQSQGYFFRPL